MCCCCRLDGDRYQPARTRPGGLEDARNQRSLLMLLNPMKRYCAIAAFASISRTVGGCCIQTRVSLGASRCGHACVRRRRWREYRIEPLGDEFTVEELARSLAGRTGAIKPVLLNQAVIAGIGNIYADEALYYASIHPLRPASRLTQDREVRLLRDGIVAVLDAGHRAWRNAHSTSIATCGARRAKTDNHVQVYQQDGKPCPALWHTD